MNPTSILTLVAAVSLLGCREAELRPLSLDTYSLDGLAPGALPSDWRALETNSRGTPASWRVLAQGVGRTLQLAQTSNAEDTFNLVLLPGTLPADLSLSVRVRADSGREDRGGGLVWRARGADDYYVARWNPLEENVRAYHVVGGRRTMIASADVVVDPAAWHELEVTAKGDEARIALDGREVLRYRDTTLTGPGAIGVWTKADAATSFEGLRVAPAGGL